jgi:hypothetical protein
VVLRSRRLHALRQQSLFRVYKLEEPIRSTDADVVRTSRQIRKVECVVVVDLHLSGDTSVSDPALCVAAARSENLTNACLSDALLSSATMTRSSIVSARRRRRCDVPSTAVIASTATIASVQAVICLTGWTLTEKWVESPEHRAEGDNLERY